MNDTYTYLVQRVSTYPRKQQQEVAGVNALLLCGSVIAYS
jgi:hypothetical protein